MFFFLRVFSLCAAPQVARDRWHKAIKMVKRAVMVKKITGGMINRAPEKGMSLNERLQVCFIIIKEVEPKSSM